MTTRPPPPSTPPQTKPIPFAVPELATLQRIRRLLASGGIRRTPSGEARIASFRVVEELIRVLIEFKRRLDAGQRVRLVEVERPSTPGRFAVVLEIVSADTPEGT